MAGVDITNMRMHLKVLLFPATVPSVHTRTINFDLAYPWTTINKVTLKNKLTNSFGYNAFCGQFNRVWWFAGFYIEDNSLNMDL
jgi:hypothetical protein